MPFTALQFDEMWIAACCLVRQLPLGTFNIKDFADFAEEDPGDHGFSRPPGRLGSCELLRRIPGTFSWYGSDVRRSVTSRYRPGWSCVADAEVVVVETRSSEAQPAGAGRLGQHASDATSELSGDVDATTHEVVRDGLADSVAGPSAEVVIALHGVTSLDAVTVRLLVEAQRTAVRAGHRLRVVGATGVVRQMIATCGAWHELTEGMACSAVVSPGPVTDPDGPGAAGRRRRPPDPDGYRHVGAGVADRCGRRQADEEQLLIDGEVGGTRREILANFGHVLRTDPRALVTEDFLTIADEPLVLDAILLAARAVDAPACDLKLHNPETRSLRLVRHHGLLPAFLDFFADVDAATPSACGTAMTTGQPVIIDDITTSRVFTGQPTLPVVLAAGFRAVQSFPLHDRAGDLAGVLSFHYADPRPRGRAPEQVARAAATALSELARR